LLEKRSFIRKSRDLIRQVLFKVQVLHNLNALFLLLFVNLSVFLACLYSKKTQFSYRRRQIANDSKTLRGRLRWKGNICAVSLVCCFGEESPNFRLSDGSPNTLYTYAYAARGQRHVGKQPRARGMARTCTRYTRARMCMHG